MAFLLIVAGCKSGPSSSAPPAPVPPVTLQVGQTPVVVDFASDERSRLLHLRLRKEVPDRTGLLLVFQSDDYFKIPTDYLYAPLDVVLLDAAGKVLDIEPMSESLGSDFESPVASRYALLVKAGTAATSGIAVGDTIALPPAVVALSEPARIAMELGNQTVRMEVAAKDALRQRGLMYRQSLPPDAGMIFVFPREKEQAFWMKDTRIPLDIVYLDRNGRIISIKQLTPFDMRGVSSDGDTQFAIELNQGKAAELGLKPGQSVKLPESVRNPPDLE